MRTLLALMLATATAAAEDPPFVAAARERQAKARAFEVALTIRKEWTGVTPIGSQERKDFVGVGTAKLVVDGERFWYSLDRQKWTGRGDRLAHQHCEAAFDGRWHFLRIQSEAENGERAGQFDSTNAIREAEQPGWDSTLDPLRWVFRGVSPHSLLGPATSNPKINLVWPTHFEQTGSTKVIEGKKCVEVVKVMNGFGDEIRRTIWLDPTDYRPVQGYGATIQYHQHPVFGQVPSGWKVKPADPVVIDPTRIIVTVDSFELRDSIPDERFVIKFPAGSQVTRITGNRTEELIVAADGSLVPEEKKEPPPAAVPTPEPPTRSLQLSLWVVGGVVVAFAALVVLLKRLARNRTDDSPESGDSPHLPT
jgi:hypothetical protein